jgi:hypothetical protein
MWVDPEATDHRRVEVGRVGHLPTPLHLFVVSGNALSPGSQQLVDRRGQRVAHSGSV